MAIDNKIYITGPAGSGKTFFAKQLSCRHNIPYYSLDEIKWVNDKNVKSYILSRSYSEREKLISDILSKNSKWIFDGAYCADWMNQVFIEADQIIILNTPLWLCQWRCVKRYISTYNRKTSSFKALVDLLRWNSTFNKKQLPKIMKKIKELNKKYLFILNTKQQDNGH